jgi:fido (protein-threonine AMPylation protein)
VIDLEGFVEASNAIEGFVSSVFGRRSGHPVFTQHLAAARRIAAGAPMSARGIHALVFAGIAASGTLAGDYRATGSVVGGCAGLDPRRISGVMDAWEADAARGAGGAGAEAWCWSMHHRFVVAHPFPDGNGRTARLLLNRFRLGCGLPWLAIAVEDGPEYVEAIRRWRAANAI